MQTEYLQILYVVWLQYWVFKKKNYYIRSDIPKKNGEMYLFDSYNSKINLD